MYNNIIELLGGQMMKREEKYLSFRFTGSNEIGLQEFSRFLNKSNQYFNALRSDLGKDFKLKSNIVAIEKGSFIVNISPEIVGIIELITPFVTTATDFIRIAISY